MELEAHHPGAFRGLADMRDEHLARLQADLQAANLTWTGEPTYARYNAPITPWFMRRNEIWLTLR